LEILLVLRGVDATRLVQSNSGHNCPWKPVLFEYDAIRAQAQETLIDYLDNEIALGITFTRCAVNSSDAGHKEHFSEAKDNATKAAQTVRRFMVLVEDGKIREEIDRRLAELEWIIAAL